MADDYFNESVPDGITNAIYEYDQRIECCNQDSYELLVMTFGSEVCGRDLKEATDQQFSKFAKSMETLFELSSPPTLQDAKEIISGALRQWGG